MELIFTNDFDSVKRLDEMMNSFSGRDCGTIMAEERAMKVMLFLLIHRKITVTEYTYRYNQDIRDDVEAMALYTEAARLTRWRMSGYSGIEGARINAIWQMRQMGEASYDGDFICYQEGRVCLHCGNLDLSHLLMYLAVHEQVVRFYLFTCPYQTEDGTAKYYRFDLSGSAIQGARIYQDSVWEEIRKASADVFPQIPDLDGPSS